MKIKQLMMLVLTLIGAVGLGNSVAHAASLCVHPSGAGQCFTTIQSAVDAAKTGDRIIIRAGKYIEQVIISGKDLELVGRSGAVLQAPAGLQDAQTPITGFEGRPILFVTEADVSGVAAAGWTPVSTAAEPENPAMIKTAKVFLNIR